MKLNTYYKIIGVLAVLAFLNFTEGNIAGYVEDGFDFIVSAFVFNIIAYGLILLLSLRKSICAAIIMIIISGYSYWNSYNWGVTGFSLQAARLQPLFTVWLSLFSIGFCIIGYLLTLKKKIKD